MLNYIASDVKSASDEDLLPTAGAFVPKVSLWL